MIRQTVLENIEPIFAHSAQWSGRVEHAVRQLPANNVPIPTIEEKLLAPAHHEIAQLRRTAFLSPQSTSRNMPLSINVSL
jgi:hypothetical protein